MLEKILAWITMRFGELRAGDYMDITTRRSEDKGFLFTEIRINLHKKNFDLKQLAITDLRHELDELTEKSIHRLDFMRSDAMRFASEQAIESKQASRDDVFGGSAVIMKIEILHRRRT